VTELVTWWVGPTAPIPAGSQLLVTLGMSFTA
jgi:hypothetical protein